MSTGKEEITKESRARNYSWAKWQHAQDKDGTKFIDSHLRLSDMYWDVKRAYFDGWRRGEKAWQTE